MSKPREKWWGYVKACVRGYPGMCKELEDAQDWFKEPDGTHSAAAMRPRRPTERQALDNLSAVKFSGQKKREYDGVRLAIADVLRLPDGVERFKVLDMVFWQRHRRTLAGASVLCGVSERTARRWHTEFLYLVAEKMGLTE